MLALDIMTHPVVAIPPDANVRTVARTMLENRISALPVIDAEQKLVGIISEGDLMRRPESGTERKPSWWLHLLADESEEAQNYVKAHGRHARDVMTVPVVTIAPDTPIAEIAALLERHHIKRVPVVRDGKVLGVVSRANLLQGLATYRPAPSVTASDRSIRAAAVEAIKKIGVGHHFVNVLVTDGVAEIWGGVWTEDERHAVEVAVENVPGVRKVENHTAVVPSIVRASGWV